MPMLGASDGGGGSAGERGNANPGQAANARAETSGNGRANAPSERGNDSPQKTPANHRTIKDSARTGTVSRDAVKSAVQDVSRSRL